MLPLLLSSKRWPTQEPFTWLSITELAFSVFYVIEFMLKLSETRRDRIVFQCFQFQIDAHLSRSELRITLNPCKTVAKSLRSIACFTSGAPSGSGMSSTLCWPACLPPARLTR